MPIPAEILAVKRPKNTIVIAYGRNKNLFAVRKRIGCKNVNGRHLPVNGPTIGHIINGVYVPIDNDEPATVSQSPVDLKDWGDIVLCDNQFKDIQNELSKVYCKEDMLKLYCISILRVCNPGISNSELKEAYDTSFLSELYPDVALSKNTTSTFLNNLGKSMSKIIQFMRNRTENIAIDHHLLVDGTLKSNNSKVNSLSDFSRKSRTKGSKDISVLYAFDLEAMEPICSKCFPGNMLDATSYKSFISENGITKGIIVADKGFPEKVAHDEFEKNPDLHYLNPIKRNSKLISSHNMLSFTELLSGYEGVTCRKEKCVGTEKWLYSYRDSQKAAKEEQDWLRRAKKDNTYTLEALTDKQKSFGTIVLECDLNLPSEIVYKAYEKRWEIELVMRFYKSACEFDETRVQDDYSVIGSEFCDFLSSILTFKLIKSFDKVSLLEKYTYKKLMSILKRAKKVRIKGSDWQLVKMNPSYEEILQEIELIPSSNKAEETKENDNIVSSETEIVSSKNKRKRGRPLGSKNKPKKTTSDNYIEPIFKPDSSGDK